MAQIPAGTNRSRQLTTKQTGDDAELRARRWLENQGLYFVAANVRERCGEIDLIMRDGAVTVFVEVRFRASGRNGWLVPRHQRPWRTDAPESSRY